ncbi:MAG: FMN-binding protein [Thiohalospira sp.]
MNLKKLILYTAVFLIAFFATPLISNWIIQKANKEAEKYIENFHPETSNLKDGLYQGKFKIFNLITLSHVEFSIKNKKVEKLKFKKMFHTPGYLSKKDIEAKIKNTHQIELDAITGATRTSNFAKAAIKNAIVHKNIK